MNATSPLSEPSTLTMWTVRSVGHFSLRILRVFTGERGLIRKSQWCSTLYLFHSLNTKRRLRSRRATTWLEKKSVSSPVWFTAWISRRWGVRWAKLFTSDLPFGSRLAGDGVGRNVSVLSHPCHLACVSSPNLSLPPFFPSLLHYQTHSEGSVFDNKVTIYPAL